MQFRKALPRVRAGQCSDGSRAPGRCVGHLARLAIRALAVLAAAVPTFAVAQSGVPLMLAEAQRLAADRSAQVASQRSMVAAAREMAIPAGELPDPKLILGVENVPADGPDRWSLSAEPMTMTRIGVMQEFPRGAKRELRAERARRDADRGSVATEAATLAVRRETATAWFALHYARRAERVVARQIAEAELQRAAAEAAYRGGRGGQNEVLAAQGAVLELRNRQVEAELASERARILLARYVGAGAADRPLGDPPETDMLPRSAAELTDIDGQPEVRVVDAQAAVLDAEAELARAGRLPDWSAELSYAIRGSAYANMVSLMVRVDLPWSPGTRQDREYAARLRERDAAREMREDTRRMRESEVRQMMAEWAAMRSQAARLRQEIIPLAGTRVESALASYRGGAGSLAMVLDARRAELESELMLLSTELALARAWAWLANVTLPSGQS